MSGYKNFAVAGAGAMGKFIIKALAEKKAEGTISSLIILTRSASGHEELAAKGAKLVAVDYSSPSSLESALAGVDVVVSTLGGNALALQEDFAKAAKVAGVKLFVPSEFGIPTDGAKDGVFALKDSLKAKLKALQLPYAVFYNGCFTDFMFQPGLAEAFGFDFANGKAAIGGSGTAEMSLTTRTDVGRFVAHALTALPKEKIEWRIFRIEGDRITYNQIAAQWTSKTGKPLAVSHRPRSDFEAALAKNPADFIAILTLELDAGRGLAGKPHELANSEWPEWKPKKAIDAILEVQGQ